MTTDEKNIENQTKAGDIKPFGAMQVPKVTPELLANIKNGEVYSLEQIVEAGVPFWEGHPPVVIAPYVRHGDMPELAPASVGNEITTLPMHGGTHIDALSHIGQYRNDEIELHGGIKVKDVMGREGYTALGAENFPPIFVKGYLLDMAGLKGVDVLPDSYGINANDLEVCQQKQGIEISEGSAILIRTGFSKYWKTDNERYSNCGAGINIDGARYLAEKKIAMVGTDTEAVEQWPFDPEGPPLPVHSYLIVEKGITHVESLYLDKIAEAKGYEFVFIALPLRIKGATGSLIHPIAIT